jgi:uncharacterized protein (TIGR00255 family)
MTGHGDARHQADGRSVAIEIRTVNSRYFKLAVRGPESYASLESRIESVVRKKIRRGTVNISLRINREASNEDYKLNQGVLESYQAQLEEWVQQRAGTGSPGEFGPLLGSLLQLPGVVDEPTASGDDLERDWPVIEPTLEMAIDSLESMRKAEGKAMEDDLQANCALITSYLEKIEQRSPEVVKNYETRLTDRLNKLLEKFDVEVAPNEVVREVGIFAERADISEETVRLRSHIEQFARIIAEPESAGRKLEFLIQEFFRETNTIGSKANDSEIAVHVVEIKTLIERMREMIQNVE